MATVNALSSDKVDDTLLQPISSDTRRNLRRLTHWRDREFIDIHYLPRTEQFKFYHKMRTVSGGIKDLGQTYVLQQIAGRIPGAKFPEKSSGLLLPASMYSALVIHHVVPQKTFQSQLIYQYYTTLLMQWQLYYIAAKKQAAFRSTGELCDVAKSFPMPQVPEGCEPIVAAPYQRCAAACAVSVPGYGLHMKPGTGKTFTAIMAMEHLARKFHSRQRVQMMAGTYTPRAFRVIICSPVSVMYNWECELEKFSTLKGRVIYCTGSNKIKRIERMIDLCCTPSKLANEKGYDWSALIVSHGMLARVINDLRDFDTFDVSIFDEAHRHKGPKNQITRACHMLREISTNRYGLTGTPMPNHPGELWSQLEFMQQGLSGFNSAAGFKKTCEDVVEVTSSDFRGQLEGSVGGRQLNLLQEKLIMSTFTMTKEEALPDLPPKRFARRGVTMSREQADMYRRILESLEVEIEHEIDRGEREHVPQQMIMQNVLKRMLRLSQVTSGFYVTDTVYDENDGVTVLRESETHRFDPNPKIETVVEYLREAEPNSKTILWAHWRQTIRTLHARLNIENINHVLLYGETQPKMRVAAMHAFNTDPNVRVFIGSSAGGEGVNLLGQADESLRCDRVGIVDQDFNAVTREQQEDRNHRKGVTWSVEYTDFVVPGTIDQEIREAVVEKRIRSLTIQDVRTMLANLRNQELSEYA